MILGILSSLMSLSQLIQRIEENGLFYINRYYITNSPQMQNQ